MTQAVLPEEERTVMAAAPEGQPGDVRRSLPRGVLVAGVILSLLVGAVHVYPDFRFVVGLGQAYQGIGLAGATDELIYLARINHAVHGGPWTLNSVFNIEHTDSPWFYGFVGEWATALVVRGLSFTPTQTDVLLTFLFPIMIFWLAAVLIYRLSRSWRVAGLWSALLVFGYQFVTSKPLVLLDHLQNPSPPPLWFVRPISPQFNYLLLLGALILIFRAVEKESRASAVAAGVLTGALVYTFLYHWTFLSAGLGVLVLVGLFTRRRAWVGTALLVLGIAAVLAIPYGLNTWKAMQHPNYPYLAERDGLLVGRALSLPLLYTVGSLVVILALSRRRTLQFWFVTSFLLGGLVCLNQQLITGVTLQPGHWQNYSLKTFLIVAIATALGQSRALLRFRMSPKTATAWTVAGIMVLAGLGFWHQNQYYKAHWKTFADKQPLAPVMRWLNAHTTSDAVVLTNPFHDMERTPPMRVDVLAYSHNYVYLPSFSDTLLSRDEVEDRYLAALHLFNYSSEEAERFFTNRNGVFFRSMSALPDYGGTPLSPQYLRSLNERYRAVRQQNPLRALGKFRLDYVLVRADEVLRLNHLPRLKPIYDDGQYVLFRVS